MARGKDTPYTRIHASKRPANPTLLAMWLQEHGVSGREFARRVGCNFKMAQYWANGQALPTLVYAFKIERATEGGVPVSSWLGTELGKLAWYHGNGANE